MHEFREIQEQIYRLKEDVREARLRGVFGPENLIAAWQVEDALGNAFAIAREMHEPEPDLRRLWPWPATP